MRDEPQPITDARRTIGDHVRRHRLWANCTQDELVRRTGLDRRTVQRVERGESDARLSWLLLIAQALDMPLAQLVSGPAGAGTGTADTRGE